MSTHLAAPAFDAPTGAATAAKDTAILGWMRLFQFRNYHEQTVDLGRGLNVITGPNAQGKTNLLEGIATLLLTRSPRAGSMADVLAWGRDAGLVEADVVRSTGTSRLGLRLDREASSNRVTRSITVNGNPRSARSVLGCCPVVLFWPDDLQLVKAGPESRRRLLDMVLAQLDPHLATGLLRYRRIVEQRNAGLRRIRDGAADPAEVVGFTRELVEVGSRIQVARSQLVTSLDGFAKVALADITGGDERLQLRYLANGWSLPMREACHENGVPPPVTAVAADLQAAMDRRSSEEIARGVSLVGPHRDDVEIVLNDRCARATASQGQQRSIVLACKFAEVRHVTRAVGGPPLLLLDDVLSELDALRREALLAALAADAGLQVVMTTSEPDLEVDVPQGVHRFQVSAGRIHQA